MALTPEFNAIEAASNKEIWIYNNTGIYNSNTNTGGYYGANPATGDVTTCTVVLSLPDPVTLKPSTDPSLQFTFSALPLVNVIGTKFVIANTDCGLLTDQNFIDGQYGFKITQSGTFSATPFSYEWKGSFVFFNQLCCCAKEKVATADLDDCGCAPCRDKLFKNLLIQLGVQGVISNNNCAKPNQALEILKVTTGMCNEEGCTGCN